MEEALKLFLQLTEEEMIKELEFIQSILERRKEKKETDN